MRFRFLLPLAALAIAAPSAAPESYGPEINARVFDRSWKLVEEHYWNRALTGDAWLAARDAYRARIVAAADRRALYTLLGEMLDRLGDSHVFAIDPVQLAIERDHDKGRALGGFGFTMLPDDQGAWRIAALRGGGPAAAAGVQIGWELRSVDGRPVDIDYVPKPGEAATLDFVDDDGKRHAVRLAAVLEEALPVRRATRLPGNMLLLGLDGFDPGADRWMRQQIAAAAPAAVILDLRDNPGGDADVIARCAGLFFTRDRVLVRRIGAHDSDQMTKGAGQDAWSGPLAVLIGPDSASGAEALAALIDESGRGVTIGQRTAGALTGAALYRLPDGGQLSVSEFDIRTPGGRRLEGQGLSPRVAVTPSLAERRSGRDPVLEAARRIVGKGVDSRR